MENKKESGEYGEHVDVQQTKYPTVASRPLMLGADVVIPQVVTEHECFVVQAAF